MTRSLLFALLGLLATLGVAIALLLWDREPPPFVEPGASGAPAIESNPGEANAAVEVAQLAAEGSAAQERVAEASQSGSIAGSTIVVYAVDEGGAAMTGVLVQAIERGERRGNMVDGNPQERIAYDPGVVLSSAVSGADGSAHVFGLPSHDQLSLFISKEGFAGVEIDVTTSAPDEIREVGPVPMRAGVIYEIEVVDVDGIPVANEHFEIAWRLPKEATSIHGEGPYSPIMGQTAKTNQEGFARFAYLPSEPEARMSFRGLDMGPNTKIEELDGSTDEVKRLRITVPAREWVEGRVVDSAGEAVAGAQVTVRRGESWALEREEGASAEDYVGKPAGVYWHSHSSIEHFQSEHITDVDGRFRIDLRPKSQHRPDETGMSDLVAATALIGPDLLIAGTWTRKSDQIELVVPVTHQIRGRVVDVDGKAVANTKIAFYTREDPNVEEDESQEEDYSRMKRPTAVPCNQSGGFQRAIEPGVYWAAVQVPGGRHRFAGPFEVNGPTEFPDFVIERGADVVLELRASDPNFRFGEVRAIRSEQPKEETDAGDGSLGGLFGGGRKERKPNTPWGARDYYWGVSRRGSGYAEGSEVIWRNQPEGDWRYSVEISGFVPVLIDCTVTPGSGGQRFPVELEELGAANIRAIQRTGEAASGVTIQIFPVAGEGKHPVHARLSETSGVFHDEGYAAVPDANGVARFVDVIPGTYEIFSIEGANDRGYLRRQDDGAPSLGQVVIASGQTSETEVALSALAEIRVTVISSGELVEGAQVFAQAVQPDRFRGRFGPSWFSGDQERFTDASGSHLIPALVPGQLYRVGACIPEAGREWRNDPAWTIVEVTPEVGTTELSLALASGRIELTVAGDPTLGVCEVTALSMASITPLPADADERAIRVQGRIEHFDRVDPWHERKFRRGMATRIAAIGETVQLTHLSPGRYRVLVTQGEGFDNVTASTISEEFEIGEGVHDLGQVHVQPWSPIHVTIDRTVLGEEGQDYELHCRAVGAQRDAAELSVGFSREATIEIDSHLAPGQYVIVLRKDLEDIVTSKPFEVVAGQEARFSWTIPVLE